MSPTPTRIAYKAGYKYQLVRDYALEIPIRPAEAVETEYVRLDTAGTLTVRAGYAWDGPSGPTLDTRNFMRGALVHDALYQLIRHGELAGDHRLPADRLLRAHCIEDGMSRLRAWWVYQGVRLGGGPAASPVARKPIHTAP